MEDWLVHEANTNLILSAGPASLKLSQLQVWLDMFELIDWFNKVVCVCLGVGKTTCWPFSQENKG